MGMDWKRVDLYGKMGVSKIVREIEGKDEFGRDYTDIIATIFKYRLTIPEGEKLRKIFYRVKEELKNKSFSVEKAKFVGIKNSNEGIKRLRIVTGKHRRSKRSRKF